MYLNTPKSCEFGGCSLFYFCPNKGYRDREHEGKMISPPEDLSKCVKPCERCVECFTYMDKYNNSSSFWAEMHGLENE